MTFQANFFNLTPSFTVADQANLLAFEAGKEFWFSKINAQMSGTAPTAREWEFRRFADGHDATIAAMRKFGQYGGKDLSHLSDDDYQSKFSYIYRVVVLGIAPPDAPPAGYSAGRWDAIKQDWNALRSAFKPYLDDLLASK
jgi:hypothetical protein